MSADVLSSRAMQWASKVQNIADQARDLTLEAAQSVGLPYKDDSKSVNFVKLLDGRSDKEKIDGMRRIISLSTRGTDMSEYFASVVKNVASSNLELRKLVYIYIIEYAESQPDLALLSINTIQKALSDQNQIVRALALRVMSSIRVQSISGIVLLAIKKCMTDSSFFVRKSTAAAIYKLNMLNPDLHSQLVDCLQILLADFDASVLSSALATFELICGSRYELLHSDYRRCCALLPKMDGLAQVTVLRILTSYARQCFERPTSKIEQSEFYVENSVAQSNDLRLLVHNTERLLMSSSSSVVIAASRTTVALGTSADTVKIVTPLLALLRTPADSQYAALTGMVAFINHDAAPWFEYCSHFFIFPSDLEAVWALKLEILLMLHCEGNTAQILPELLCYSQDRSNPQLVRAAIQGIGRCAQSLPSALPGCMKILFNFLKDASDICVSEAVIAIRHLVQLQPDARLAHIKGLVRQLENVHASSARASIFWLVHENLDSIGSLADDVLRIGAQCFKEQEINTKLQILALAVKMYIRFCQSTSQSDVQEINHVLADDEKDQQNTYTEQILQDVEAQEDHRASLPDMNSPVPVLYAYLLQLARYDMSYDLRDRLRTYKVLASSPTWALTQRLLFTPKPTPIMNSLITPLKDYNPGSSSAIVGKRLGGYLDLPEWSTTTIGAEERKRENQAPVSRHYTTQTTNPSSPAMSRNNSDTILAPTAITRPKSKLTGITSLDDFYATSSEEEKTGSESGSEEDTEEESSEYESSDDE